MAIIKKLIFDGVEFSKYPTRFENLNYLSRTEEAERSLDFSMPTIDTIPYAYIPRFFVTFSYLTRVQYQELMALVNKTSFDLEYFDVEYNRQVIHNFYALPISQGENVFLGGNIVGVKNLSFEFAGTEAVNSSELVTHELSVFEMTINITNVNFYLPEYDSAASYDYYVNWGDGLIEHISKTTSSANKETLHTYSSLGQYVIQINGTFPYMKFAGAAESTEALISINNWGNLNIIGSFSGCSNLQSFPSGEVISLNNTITETPVWLCYYCSKLVNAVVRSGITNLYSSIFGGAFAYCSLLESVVLPITLTTIGLSSFSVCSSLSNIVLHENITSIGNGAFANSGLNQLVIYAETPPTLGTGVFTGSGISASAGNIYVPNDSVVAYQEATGWSTFATRISAITHNITYVSQGATLVVENKDWIDIGGEIVQNVLYGEEITTMPTSSDITRTGYTFGGWFTEINGGGTEYSGASEYLAKGDITLYAKWTAIATYNVLFNKQGGTGGTNNVSATNGVAMPTATAPTRIGYTFGGYYSAVSGGGSQYYTDAMASAKSYDLTTNCILYAKWTAV
jgi:uncharacterized repeat protein (TIGR02543 family)